MVNLLTDGFQYQTQLFLLKLSLTAVRIIAVSPQVLPVWHHVSDRRQADGDRRPREHGRHARHVHGHRHRRAPHTRHHNAAADLLRHNEEESGHLLQGHAASLGDGARHCV